MPVVEDFEAERADGTANFGDQRVAKGADDVDVHGLVNSVGDVAVLDRIAFAPPYTAR